ncbi:hypothetical protein GLAREA_12630 [Glarea lozoyensis ATCC 20868]|uniref:ABM domain-containing protein n=1 Tax=Glarea lozoyensis (strain ATCC 20868 / MF5171) TaxID=1116229 RepID=S3CYI1_GLAL2|nr:uncharacterized protein GLAREA_12630 [Glarea lozoyensis ATCC 20868]EPE31327.1 hypothetical protein GLAREA_12630 [Glarea lozoyensis ATCC 20868]
MATENSESSLVVASWTTLQVPKSSTFDTRNTEDGRTWLSIIRPMTRSKQPGFLHGIFGRVVESMQTVWLVTAWESSEALEKFEASSTWSTQRELMASMSMTFPKTVHCDFSGFWWDRLTPHTGVTDLSFPSSIAEDVCMKILGVKGLEYFFRPGASEPKAFNGSGVRGWIRGTSRVDDVEVITLRVFDHWMSDELETEFKTKASTLEGEEGILVYDRFVRDFKELGMVNMKERHCRFTHIPTTFY